MLQGGCTSFVVPAGVTLTLAAGTVIKANSCAQLAVYGSLVADGTAADPVVFTSYADDSVGGDTNADGSVSSPAAGDWSGIYAQGGSLSLDHAKVASWSGRCRRTARRCR